MRAARYSTYWPIGIRDYRLWYRAYLAGFACGAAAASLSAMAGSVGKLRNACPSRWRRPAWSAWRVKA